MSEALDRFLVQCLRNFLTSQDPPAFPASSGIDPAYIFDRVAFHGLALLLVQLEPRLFGWPDDLQHKIREQARLQSFWETAHKAELTDLFEILAHNEIKPIVFKGTALAYSVYPNPALRRRGDTDILIAKKERPAVRKALKALGFKRLNDTVSLQETWTKGTTYGFNHDIDVHWRWKSSALISAHLERGLNGQSLHKAQMGSQEIHTTDPIGTIILLSVNRCSHESFGDKFSAGHPSGSDRLIWAADFDLVTRLLEPDDWAKLAQRAADTDCSKLVREALLYAQDTVGTSVPESILDALNQPDSQVAQYLFDLNTIQKLRADLSASTGLLDRVELIRYRLFPSSRVLTQRYPDAAGWPLPALQARRLISSLYRLIARPS